MVKRLSVGFWTLNPELAKAGKFLTGRQRGINRQTTRGKAIDLACANDAEIAGTEHADDFIVFVFAVDRVQHFEPGEAEVFDGVFIMLNIAKIGNSPGCI
ncbi:Uncharacterised protein [Citrobacter koseri]|nr:Uncharacterised protein [Citrobacter koseri]